MAQDLDDARGSSRALTTGPIWNQEGGHALWLRHETNAGRGGQTSFANDTAERTGRESGYHCGEVSRSLAGDGLPDGVHS